MWQREGKQPVAAGETAPGLIWSNPKEKRENIRWSHACHMHKNKMIVTHTFCNIIFGKVFLMGLRTVENWDPDSVPQVNGDPPKRMLPDTGIGCMLVF